MEYITEFSPVKGAKASFDVLYKYQFILILWFLTLHIYALCLYIFHKLKNSSQKQKNNSIVILEQRV